MTSPSRLKTTMKAMNLIYFSQSRLFPSDYLVSDCTLAGILNCVWVGWQFKWYVVLLLLLAEWCSNQDDGMAPLETRQPYGWWLMWLSNYVTASQWLGSMPIVVSMFANLLTQSSFSWPCYIQYFMKSKDEKDYKEKKMPLTCINVNKA